MEFDRKSKIVNVKTASEVTYTRLGENESNPICRHKFDNQIFNNSQRHDEIVYPQT